MSQVSITVRQFISDNAALIGFRVDDPCALNLVNQARFIAYPTGDWVGTIGYTGIPTERGQFLLPAQFDAIREVRQCSVNGTVSANMQASDYYNCGGQIVVARLHGRAYSPIACNGRHLYVKCLNLQDVGKVINFDYVDNLGSERNQDLILQHGSKQNGEDWCLDYVPNVIRKIVKPVTVGRVYLTNTSVIGYLEPWERIPTYSIYQTNGLHCGGPVYVKAKKKCIPYTEENLDDILDINPEALGSFLLAAKEKGNQGQDWITNYRNLVRLGTDFLKTELTNENDTSIGMTPVSMNDSFFNDLSIHSNAIYGDDWMPHRSWGVL